MGARPLRRAIQKHVEDPGLGAPDRVARRARRRRSRSASVPRGCTVTAREPEPIAQGHAVRAVSVFGSPVTRNSGPGTTDRKSGRRSRLCVQSADVDCRQPRPARAGGAAREARAAAVRAACRHPRRLPPPRSRLAPLSPPLRHACPPACLACSRRPPRRPRPTPSAPAGADRRNPRRRLPDRVARRRSRHYLGVKVGDPYDPDKIRDNFQTLWDVGLLENLSDRGGARRRRRDARSSRSRSGRRSRTSSSPATRSSPPPRSGTA